MGDIVSTLAFPSPDKAWSQADLLRRERVNQLKILTTRSGHRIPAVHILRDSSINDAKFTLIYSHGNAEDVGLSLPYLDRLSQRCDCNVLAYEYCGYSIAEGEASEKNCYECIDAAYEYLIEVPVDPSRIVLFGRSLGTGPTVDLAGRLLSKSTSGTQVGIAGVVLQSPLESAGRCVLGEIASYALYFFDLFRSYEKIEKLAPVPVFIMHGIEDKVVPCASGRALYNTLTQERRRRLTTKKERDHHGGIDSSDEPSVEYSPKWIPGVGHNDMSEFECMNDVRDFLHFLEQRQGCL